jgi:hypothetical protein
MDQFTIELNTLHTLIIPKEKKTEKKRKPYRQGENEADARFLTTFFELEKGVFLN